MRSTSPLLAGIALLVACGTEPTIVANDATMQPPMNASPSRAIELDIAALRAATVAFKRFETAQRAGWSTQAPPGCFTSPDGAMGLHYLKASNVGTLDVTKPQFLMYEPQQNGGLKLVGVEFIVPGAPTDTPPVLFAQTFHYNATFGVWLLHVWAWQYNPSGVFSDWNPRVTCNFATTLSPVSHH